MNGVSPITHRGLRLEAPPNGARPQTFGPYLLVERVRATAESEVWKAVALQRGMFGGVVSITCFRPELTRSPTFENAFLDGATRAAALEHQNIARVIDFGLVGDTYYVATERLDGWPLGSVLRALGRARLNLRATLVAEIAVEIARGLEYAHAGGLLHLRLGPGTVTLLRTGGVKIHGFGTVDFGDRPTRQLRYFSPEQARGQPVDARTDVFALGITTWEMLTGHHLFGGATPIDCMGNLLHGPINPPSALRPTVPAALDRIVLRALERDRFRRYESTGQMIDDLDQVLGGRRMKPDSVRHVLTSLFGAPQSRRAGARPPTPGRTEAPPVQAAAAAAADRREQIMRRATGALILVALLCLLLVVVRIATAPHTAAAPPPPPARAAAAPAARKAPPPPVIRGPAVLIEPLP